MDSGTTVGADTAHPAGGSRAGTALVLGANGLMGVAIAERLARRGHRTLLAARDGDALEATRSRLTAQGVEVRAVALDATDDDTLAELVDGEDLRVAVNSLGTTHRPTPLAELPIDELDRVLASSLRAVAVALRAELRAMSDGGAIVNVTSTAGIAGVPGMAAYVAAKHGVVGLTRAAALDAAPRGIRINAVAPGPIESGPIMRQPAEVRSGVGERVPMGRMGTADEVAAAVDWLTSPGSAYVTGTVLPVDGGRTAGGA